MQVEERWNYQSAHVTSSNGSFQYKVLQSLCQNSPTMTSHKLKSGTNWRKKKKSLQFLGAFYAHKTLGHYEAPAGTQAEQFWQLLEKSNSTMEFLWKCPFH
jgi:hypothetical protein